MVDSFLYRPLVTSAGEDISISITGPKEECRMAKNRTIKVGPLKQNELAEADRIVRLAFGTFLGLPNPLDFMGDRNFMLPRWRSAHVRVIAAREAGRLVGTNVLTRWGSFGFFGPLTVLPEYWNRGVAQHLLEATLTAFDAWGLRHTGLFTFPQSVKHVRLYQKFGYWPRYLTAIMTHKPEKAEGGTAPMLLSDLPRSQRERAIRACRMLTHKIAMGLDLTGEIRAMLEHQTGDVVLTCANDVPDAFAVCMNGPGSEGGSKTCYVKFGAAHGGSGASKRFDSLLDACEAFAFSRGANIEAGVNLARENAYRHMASRGYQATNYGVAMERPHTAGFNRAEAWVIDDWR